MVWTCAEEGQRKHLAKGDEDGAARQEETRKNCIFNSLGKMDRNQKVTERWRRDGDNKIR